MKTTVNQSAFIDAFHAHNRFDQFGYKALVVLFDYLESYEEETGEEIELDVIALCCDYAHDTITDIAEQYGIDLSDCADEAEQREAVLDWLNDNTAVCGETDTGIVYCISF